MESSWARTYSTWPRTSQDAAEPTDTAPVSITETGFDPEVVTITVGTTVEWTNLTQETVRVIGGVPYSVYLPLVVRNWHGGGLFAASPHLAGALLQQQDGWGSGEIPPNGTFAHTFTESGSYPYFLANNPHLTGLVVLQPVPFDFALGLAPPGQSVAQGQTVTYTVGVTTTAGEPQPVALAVGGLPPGATGELRPATLTPTGTAILTVTTVLTTPLGSYTVVVTGTGGGQVHTATASLSVTPHPDFALAVSPPAASTPQGQAVAYTVQVTALNGFDSPISLTLQGQPAGVMAEWEENPVVPTSSTVLTLTTSLDTPIGSWPLTVIGTSDWLSHQAAMTLEVTPHADFSIGIQPPTQVVTQGLSVEYVVSLTPQYGFAEPVTLSVTGLPVGATATWSVNPVVPPGASALTVTAAGNTPAGSYTLQVTATSGGLSHWGTAGLTVVQHEGFALAIDPEAQSVPQGEQAFYVATVTGLFGFAEPVTLAVEGLPVGVTPAIVPNPVVPTATATVTLATALDALVGDHALVLSATGGGRIHIVPFTLTITPHPDFALAAAPPAQTVTQGQAVTYTVFVTGEQGFSQPVTLTIEVLPNGATSSWETNPVIPTGQTFLTVSTQITTPSGGYPMLLTGTGGGFTHTEELNLTVLTVMPDLVIESIDITPETRVQGQEVLVAMSIRNLGIVPTGPFQADWYMNPSSPPEQGDSGTLSWQLEGLGAGAGVVVTASYIFTEVGDFPLWAQADTLDAVTEVDETNNVLGPVMATVLSDTQQVCGVISQDTIWYTGVTYIATCDVTVSSGVTLTTQAGVRVKFNGYTGLNVYGNLVAQGTSEDPITFTNLTGDETGEKWEGISVSGSATLDHIVVELTSYSWGPIQIYSSDVHLTNSLVRNNRDGVYLAAGATLEGNTITNNDSANGAVWINYGTGAALMNNTILNNGGAGIQTNTGVTLASNTISGNAGYAVQIALAAVKDCQLGTNVLTGNGYDAIGIEGGSLTGDHEWGSWLSDYDVHILSNLYVGYLGTTSGSLTLSPGTTLRFRAEPYPSYAHLIVQQFGTLTAQGTADAPIVFTANRASPGTDLWGGVLLYSNSTATLDHVIIEYVSAYSGGAIAAAALRIESSDVTVQHSTIRYSGTGVSVSYAADSMLSGNTITDNSDWGVVIWGDGSAAITGNTITQNGQGVYLMAGATLDNNTISNNNGYAVQIVPAVVKDCQLGTNVLTGNGYDAIGIEGGSLTGDHVWGTWLADYEVHVLGLSVNYDGTLTLPAGATLRFPYTQFTVSGNLIAQGTAADPITFTNISGDAAGEKWQGIYLAGSGTLDHIVVEYTDNSYGPVQIYSSDVQLTNSLIHNNRDGVYLGAAATLEGNTITNNTGSGVCIAYGTGAMLIGNAISNNGGVGIQMNAGATLNGNTITNNANYAVLMDAAAVKDSLLANNVFSGNGHDAIQIGAYYALTGDHTWGTWLADYEIHMSALAVGYDGTLTLPAGATLRFPYMQFNVSGNLIAQGTADHPITFTSISGSASGEKWQGIYLAGSGTLDHIVVEYTDSSRGPVQIYSSDVQLTNSLIHNNRDGVYLGAAATLEGNTITNNTNNGGVWIEFGPGAILTNNTISNNGGPGVQANVAVTLVGNTIVNNAGYAVQMSAAAVQDSLLEDNILNSNLHDAIEIGGQVYGDHIWGAWLTDYDVHVSSLEVGTTYGISSSLTLPAGANLKFLPYTGYYFQLIVHREGSLIAQGTASAPITMTVLSNNPGTERWGGIIFEYESNQAVLDYVLVEYAAPPYGSASIDLRSHAVTITHSNIRYNSQGIGVCTQADPFIIQNNNIYDNAGYGLQNCDSAIPIEAEYNWWGSDSGPAPYGSGNGINYATCWDAEHGVYYICDYYVDADPWLGKAASTGAQLGTDGSLSSIQAFIAEPVNTANGNYLYEHTDLAIPTCGLSLDFARTYNSLIPQSGALGYGWTHNWNVRLTENTEDGSVTIVFGDSHTEWWAWTGTAYDGGPGVFGVLIKNGDGSYDLTQKDQTSYHFEINGRLAWAEDRNANRMTLAYDGNGRLLTITEPAGRTLTLEYSSPVSTTLISRMSDSISRNTQYTYDTNADLVAVTDVTGQVTSMTYDANHRLLTMTDANGHTFVTNVYDANQRVSDQYDALNNHWIFAYDEPSHKTLVTDPRGYITTYQYDGDWRLISEKDGLNYTTSYAYDTDNNRIQVTDKRGDATHYAYDARGNALVITDTLGFTRTFTYDGQNNLLAERDPRGNLTEYEYDPNSNMTRRTDALGHDITWTYNSYGEMLSVTDPLTHTTGYGYDAWGNLAVITDALRYETAFTYDAAGRKIEDTDALGRVITYAYDAANRLLSVSEPLGKVTSYGYDAVGNRISLTDPRSGVTAFVYDEKDRLIRVTDPLSHTTFYGYDAVDNQTSVTNPLSHTTAYAYDALNRRTSVTDPLVHATGYQYDPNGNLTHLTDANGKVTQYGYDVLNRLTSVTDAESGVVAYAYDANGNRTSMTDANQHTTIYMYDPLNRLIGVTDPLSHTVSYGYDAVGNRTGHIKADGTVLTYVYDARDYLTAISGPNMSIGYAYDAVGNRTAMTDSLGVTSYEYDQVERLVQVTAPGGALGYAYDPNDNRTQLTYPNGSVVTYTYDVANRLTAVTDWAGRVTTYIYDIADRQTAIDYANAAHASYAYDAADRLLSIAHTSSVSGTLAVFTYTLDAVGNRLTMQDLDGMSSYGYDNLYRLKQVTYPDAETVAYTYDPMGNRTAMTSTVSGVVTYTYDSGDRLLTAGLLAFAWDANGNMIGKGSAAYTYDALDRLTQVITGTTTVQFAYDGDGARLRKTINETVTDYLQDKAVLLPLVLSETTGGATSRYVYGHDLLEQTDPAGDPTFYHADGLGSTRALSDEAGQRTDAYSYDAFGTVRSHTGSSGQPFTFTGEQGDIELGMIFLRARYYDGAIGRFSEPDPLRVGGHSQKHNLYAYALNNPVTFVDPSGNISLDWLTHAAGSVIGAAKFAYTWVLEGNDPTIEGSLGTADTAVGLYNTGRDAQQWRSELDRRTREQADALMKEHGATEDLRYIYEIKVQRDYPYRAQRFESGISFGCQNAPIIGFGCKLLWRLLAIDKFSRNQGGGTGEVLDASVQRGFSYWGAPPSTWK